MTDMPQIRLRPVRPEFLHTSERIDTQRFELTQDDQLAACQAFVKWLGAFCFEDEGRGGLKEKYAQFEGDIWSAIDKERAISIYLDSAAQDQVASLPGGDMDLVLYETVSQLSKKLGIFARLHLRYCELLAVRPRLEQAVKDLEGSSLRNRNEIDALRQSYDIFSKTLEKAYNMTDSNNQEHTATSLLGEIDTQYSILAAKLGIMLSNMESLNFMTSQLQNSLSLSKLINADAFATTFEAKISEIKQEDSSRYALQMKEVQTSTHQIWKLWRMYAPYNADILFGAIPMILEQIRISQHVPMPQSQNATDDTHAQIAGIQKQLQMVHELYPKIKSRLPSQGDNSNLQTEMPKIGESVLTLVDKLFELINLREERDTQDVLPESA